jgi:ribosomal protein S18 acetylase RimI-like enzyme
VRQPDPDLAARTLVESDGGIGLRTLGTDDWVVWRELRLEALREAPGAFSSTLAQWQGAGDTETRWRALLSTVALNVVADLDGKSAGMVSATAADRDGTVELISMWVAPFARGRGVGDSLIAAVVEWALERTAARISLAVVESNERAVALYRRHGFRDAGAIDCSGTGVSEREMVLNLKATSRR